AFVSFVVHLFPRPVVQSSAADAGAATQRESEGQRGRQAGRTVRAATPAAASRRRQSRAAAESTSGAIKDEPRRTRRTRRIGFLKNPIFVAFVSFVVHLFPRPVVQSSAADAGAATARKRRPARPTGRPDRSRSPRRSASAAAARRAY